MSISTRVPALELTLQQVDDLGYIISCVITGNTPDISRDKLETLRIALDGHVHHSIQVFKQLKRQIRRLR